MSRTFLGKVKDVGCVKDVFMEGKGRRLCQGRSNGKSRTSAVSRTFLGKVKDVGCVKDVLRQLDGACSGRTSCDVSVRSFVDLHPCQKDFVSYLEASYECVEGIY